MKDATLTSVADDQLTDPFVDEAPQAAEPVTTPAPTPVEQSVTEMVVDVVGGTVVSETATEVLAEESADQAPLPVEAPVAEAKPELTRSELISLVLLQGRQIAELRTRVEALEQGKGSARSKFEGKVEDQGIFAQVAQLPGFDCCSLGTRLGDGEKCNKHGRPGNNYGICPVAHNASKLITSVGLEKALEITTKANKQSK